MAPAPILPSSRQPLGFPARALLAAGLAAAGVVHIGLAPHHFAESILSGLAFAIDGVLLVAIAQWLALTGARAAHVLGAATAAATAAAYVATRAGLVSIGHAHGWDAFGVSVTAIELAVAATAVVSTRRRLALVLALLTVSTVAPAAVLADNVPPQPSGCVTPNKQMTLYAEELPRENGQIRIGWGRTPPTASIPGPLIELVEGDCIAITVVNDVSYATLAELWRNEHDGEPPTATDPIGISLHVHGVKYTSRSDGTVQNDSWVRPGAARTFIWYAAPRVTVGSRIVSLGTAGYWWYHDHIAGTDHGTGGLKAGLFGGMIVRRPGDVRPDRTYTVVLGPDPTINFKRYPQTFACGDLVGSSHCFLATEGERVEFLVLVIGDNFHTFHLHAHTWADNRTGMFSSQADEARLIDVKTLGPSETFGFQIIAGEEVGPGIWMLHCHVQSHSDDGMATFFKVLPRSGVDLHPGVPAMAGHEGHH